MLKKVARHSVGNLHVEQVSDSISFQYSVENGERKHEGLVASNRWYPAIRGIDRFLFGIRQENRFVPGILWCDTFIPGLVICGVFVPGIVVGDQFVPGVIASGVFVPGIVQGSLFVPGLVNQRRFVPGAFTSDCKFAPGLIEDGGFSIGLADSGSFVSLATQRIPLKEVDELSRDGYGFSPIRRFQHLGGVPLAGAVLATFGDTGFLTYRGLLTDNFLVLGGLRDGQDLVVMDSMQSLIKGLKAIGIDVGDPNDPSNKLHGGDIAQKRIEQMAKDLSSGLFGTGVGAWQSGGAAIPFGEVASALEGMSQGVSDMMDRMNKQWKDYWDGLLGAGQGGVTSGGGNGRIRGWVTDAGKAIGGKTGEKVAGAIYDIATATAAGAALGGEIAGVVGAAFGGIVGYIVGVVLWLTGSSESEQKPPDNKPPGGTQEPGEDGGGANDVVVGGGSHPKPLMPYIVHRTKLIQVDLGEYDMSAYGSVSTKDSAIKVKVTDTGVVTIINYQALRSYAMSHARNGGPMVVNPLTGEVEMWYLGKVAVVVGEDVPVPYWIRFVGHPQH